MIIRTQKGFTLVETLVALVVMAVGMLGIAALYVEGLRASRTAIYRTDAVVLAADMADRIRANPGGRLNYAGSSTGASPAAPDCNLGCSTDQLVEFDWALWMAEIDQRLPSGAVGKISTEQTDPELNGLILYTIFIQWPETGQQSDVSYELAFKR
jgi:type IV pilus assembly protein PilV